MSEPTLKHMMDYIKSKASVFSVVSVNGEFGATGWLVQFSPLSGLERGSLKSKSDNLYDAVLVIYESLVAFDSTGDNIISISKKGSYDN